MPRPRYLITPPDLPAARDYLVRKLIDDSYLDHLGADARASAVVDFEHAGTDADQLQPWCDHYLTDTQWRQLRSAIRAARFRHHNDDHKHVALTRAAWRILRDLAARDRVTLSTVIEQHLAPLLETPTGDAQTAPPVPVASPPVRQPRPRAVATPVDVTRPSHLLGPGERRKRARWRTLANQHIEAGHNIDELIIYLNARTRGAQWTPHAVFGHVDRTRWRLLCQHEIHHQHARGRGWKTIADDLNYRQVPTLETDPKKQIWTGPRVKKLFENEKK